MNQVVNAACAMRASRSARSECATMTMFDRFAQANLASEGRPLCDIVQMQSATAAYPRWMI
jgi:hypothetical protein